MKFLTKRMTPSPRLQVSLSPSLLVFRCLLSPVPCLLILFSAVSAAAQPAGTTQPSGGRWAFIICGHPGDEAHQKQFADSAGRICKAMTERFRFPADHVWVRFGVDDGRTERTSANSVEPRQPP